MWNGMRTLWKIISELISEQWMLRVKAIETMKILKN